MFGRKTKLAIALAALHVYASEDFWKRSGTTARGNYQPAPYTHDHGARARDAIGAIGGPWHRRLFRRKPVYLGELRYSGTHGMAVHVTKPVAQAEDTH